MQRIKKLFVFLFLFYSYTILFAQTNACFTIEKQQSDGKDLLKLDTLWEFYPAKFLSQKELNNPGLKKYLIHVPGNWDNQIDTNYLEGFGTYHLKLINKGNSTQLVIHVGQILDAYELYINNDLIARSGKIAQEKKDFRGDFIPQIKSFQLQKGENHIVIHIANFENHHSGIYNSIEIGSPWTIFYHALLRLAYDLILFGTLIFMTIYHLALYWLRRKDRSVLLFALFSFLMAIRTVFTGGEAISYIFPGFPFQLSYKLEYLSFYFATPIFGYFLYSIFPQTIKRVIIHGILILSILFSLTVLFFQIELFTYYVIYFQFITLVGLLYFVFIMIKNVILKTEGAWAISAGALFFFISIVNDMLYINEIINTTELAPLGMFLFMFSQSYLLSLRFSKAFSRNEELSAELDYKNKNLETIVQNRTAEIQQQKEEIQTQAELLTDTNKELEKLSIVASETDNAVIIFDENLDFEWGNKAFEKIYGYTVEEFKNSSKRNFLNSTTNKVLKEQLVNFKSLKESITYESELVDKFNHKKWMQTTLSPVLDADENLIKIVAIDSDISKIKQAEQEIIQRNEEVKAQKDILEIQNRKIEIQNQNINASISYAKDIQKAILPIDNQLNKFFKHFVVYKPKDIVSGDLYWCNQVEDYLFLAVIDCTGHGVPGAFMSMIANRLISSIVNEQKILSPAEILKELDTGVMKALNQEKTENKDGMDICLIRLKLGDNEIKTVFSGAKRPLIYFDHKNNELKTIKGDRKSIGGIKLRRNTLSFTENKLLFHKGDILYLSSDGFIDQNNMNRKRFGTNRFMILLKEIVQLNMEEQRSILLKVMEEFQGKAEQRDDITILGIKL